MADKEPVDDEGMLTERELAARWKCSTKVLQAARYKGRGCPFLKIGGMIRYPLKYVRAFESAGLHDSTSEYELPPKPDTDAS